eukprot:10684764-Prorocentrum_lima.AAC.1
MSHCRTRARRAACSPALPMPRDCSRRPALRPREGLVGEGGARRGAGPHDAVPILAAPVPPLRPPAEAFSSALPKVLAASPSPKAYWKHSAHLRV